MVRGWVAREEPTRANQYIGDLICSPHFVISNTVPSLGQILTTLKCVSQQPVTVSQCCGTVTQHRGMWEERGCRFCYTRPTVTLVTQPGDKAWDILSHLLLPHTYLCSMWQSWQQYRIHFTSVWLRGLLCRILSWNKKKKTHLKKSVQSWVTNVQLIYKMWLESSLQQSDS